MPTFCTSGTRQVMRSTRQGIAGGRGKAGQLGRRRIGTVEFLKYGLCPTTFLPLTFSSLRRLALETIRSPFPVLGSCVLNKRRKLHFFECYYESCAFAISKLLFP